MTAGTERRLYCPCGGFGAPVRGPGRIVRDHATCVLAALGLNRVPCVSCGGVIAAVPSSAEGASIR